jgi:hypothetical protein
VAVSGQPVQQPASPSTRKACFWSVLSHVRRRFSVVAKSKMSCSSGAPPSSAAAAMSRRNALAPKFSHAGATSLIMTSLVDVDAMACALCVGVCRRGGSCFAAPRKYCRLGRECGRGSSRSCRAALRCPISRDGMPVLVPLPAHDGAGSSPPRH